MQTYEDLEAVSLRSSSVTIGAFDGLHLGHQALIRSAVEQARRERIPSVVVTFFPHPSVVLRGRRPAFYITLPEEKAELLSAQGVEHVVNLQFTEALSRVSAAEFLGRMERHLGLSHLWIGEDFALGHEREGNRHFLRREARRRRFRLHEVGPVKVGGEVVSSTRVREALRAGDVARAATYLGRPYRLTGTVVAGAARGKSIGFPTANLSLPAEKAFPGKGVYACRAFVGEAWRPAVTNVGLRPTFGDDLPAPIVETHLLDWGADLYGEGITLEFVARLRDEQRFASAQALVAQIGKDVAMARDLMGPAMEDNGG